jgi:hypothetical protein
MRGLALLFVVSLIGACASEAPKAPAPPPQAPSAASSTPGPTVRGVHSGEKDRIDFYYSINPTCESEGYPEMTVTKPPSHGRVFTEQGQGYPNFGRDNVRWDCDRRLVPSMDIFYQSDPGFTGNDSFAVEIRFVTSYVRSVAYAIEVR